jgi:hypothetical protein
VDWRSLKNRGVRDRLDSAFSVVDREYGVTRLLDPEGKIPDFYFKPYYYYMARALSLSVAADYNDAAANEHKLDAVPFVIGLLITKLKSAPLPHMRVGCLWNE